MKKFIHNLLTKTPIIALGGLTIMGTVILSTFAPIWVIFTYLGISVLWLFAALIYNLPKK